MIDERDRQFADAARVLDASVTMGAIGSVVARVRSDMRDSHILGAWRRVRIMPAVALATMCAVHIVLLTVMPVRLAPAKPLGYGVVVAFAVLVAAAGRITTRSSATAAAERIAGTANATKS